MKRFKRFSELALATVFAAGLILQLIPVQQASAAQITTRSLTLIGVGNDGGSKPSGVVNHHFVFDLGSTVGAIGSIKFEYCTTAANSVAVPACVAPTGASATAVTLGADTGDITAWTMNNASRTANTFFLDRASTVGATAGDTIDVRIDTMTNPSAANSTFFVRLSTYASLNTTGGVTDTGTVAASTATPIVLTGTMPESLVFCTGGTVSKTSGVPDCSTATSGSVTFDRLFSPTDTAIASSQMAASTNAGSGYNITVNGAVLTSGGNTIPGYTTNAAGDASVHGVSKFGINLRANTGAGSLVSGTPTFGADIDATSNGTTLKGAAQTGYAAVDAYRFVTADSVAQSNNGGAGGSDAQIYTASYIANVSGNQPAGSYTTTLTYICTPTF